MQQIRYLSKGIVSCTSWSCSCFPRNRRLCLATCPRENFTREQKFPSHHLKVGICVHVFITLLFWKNRENFRKIYSWIDNLVIETPPIPSRWGFWELHVILLLLRKNLWLQGVHQMFDNHLRVVPNQLLPFLGTKNCALVGKKCHDAELGGGLVKVYMKIEPNNALELFQGDCLECLCFFCSINSPHFSLAILEMLSTFSSELL